MVVHTAVRPVRRRRRTACSSSCSSTTRSTARSATGAASARCRTRPFAFGPGESRFVEEKRHFEKPIPISDLVLLDRERCILCDRCTRFADEVAGDPLIRFIDRGDETQVITFPDEPFTSYFCGNTVQICPVGALTATPYRFQARPWDLEQVESTCTSVLGRLPGRVQSSEPAGALPRRRRRPRQPGLAVRQGPLRLRGGQQRRTASASPLVRRRGPASSSRPVVRGARRAAAAIREGLDAQRARRVAVHRRRPAHQRGRLRLGQAGQGRHRHRQRRRPARRRAAGRGRARACPGPPSTTPARPAHRGPPRARPQGGAAGPVPAAARRRRRRRRPARRAGADRHRPPTTLAAHVAALPAGRRAAAGAGAARRRGRRRGGRCGAEAVAAAASLLADGRSRSCSAGPTSPSRRQSIAAAAASCTRRTRGRGSCPRCAGATCTAPSTWAWRPGSCPAGSRSRRPRLVRRRTGARARRAGPRRRRHPRGPRPTGASTRWCCSAPTRWPTSPTATSPSAALAGAGTVIAVDTFLTESVRQADVVLPAAGFGEIAGTTTNLEGRVTRWPRRSRRPAPPRPTG